MLLKDILIMSKNSQKIAIKYGDSVITYEQLFNFATDNTELIIKKAGCVTNIGIFLPNSIQYAVAYFTITLMNKVIVPLDIQIKKIELMSTIEYCDIKIIITNTMYKKVIKEFLNDFEYRIILFNLDNNTCEEVGLGKKEFCLSGVNEDIYENSVAILLHTSGTISNPKRVMLTHKNLISNIRSTIDFLQLTENDKTLIALPMFFANANTAQFLTHLYLGASIVIMNSKFIPRRFLEIVSEEKITNFTSVPSMLLMLLSYHERENYDISSLRYICFGGGNIPVVKLKELIKEFPSAGFVHTYGQTEASPRVTALLPADSLRKAGSIGKPIPNVNVRIVVSLTGQDVRVNEIGELIVQGDNVMKGYYKRPEKTEMAIKEEWLYTGDMAVYDDENYIYLIGGRKKNMIISGCFNIYPEEIEEILMRHPDVKEVRVSGEQHVLLGERPIATVVLKEGSSLTQNDLLRYCLSLLANYKVPRKINFADRLPKTATGKVKQS
jgi:long-chain acyl-CoA synthetase